ncbi:unnamed protein product [Merluccius merluccius]
MPELYLTCILMSFWSPSPDEVHLSIILKKKLLKFFRPAHGVTATPCRNGVNGRVFVGTAASNGLNVFAGSAAVCLGGARVCHARLTFRGALPARRGGGTFVVLLDLWCGSERFNPGRWAASVAKCTGARRTSVLAADRRPDLSLAPGTQTGVFLWYSQLFAVGVGGSRSLGALLNVEHVESRFSFLALGPWSALQQPDAA